MVQVTPASVNWGSIEGAGKWFNVPLEKIDITFSEEEGLEIERYCKKIKANLEKDKMTPWERYVATMEGQEVDRVSCEVGTLSAYAVRVLDGYADALKPIDLFTNPKIFLKAHMASQARFGHDWEDFYTFTYGESEWGGKARYLEMSHPVILEPGVKTIEDVERLVTPDPRKDGAYPGDLWAVKKCKEFFRKYGLARVVPVHASCCNTPEWTIPLAILGLVNGLTAPIKNPALWNACMRKATDFTIQYALALREAGADIVWCCSAPAAWPPKVFKQYGAPFAAEAAKWGYLDGFGYAFNQEKHMQPNAECGVYDTTKFIYYDNETPMELARQFTKEHDQALYYFETDKILAQGPEVIKEWVKKDIKVGLSTYPSAGYGCCCGGVDYWTPPEYVDAWVKAVKEYGKIQK